MKKLKPIDEVFGIPIYFNPISEKFYAKLSGHDFESDRLSDLKRDLQADRPVELEEPVIYSTGEMVLTTIVEITPHGSLKTRERSGYGVPSFAEDREVFPRSEKNITLFKRHRAMREKGWDLIHEADEIYQELEPYPKNYWKNKARKLKENE